MILPLARDLEVKVVAYMPYPVPEAKKHPELIQRAKEGGFDWITAPVKHGLAGLSWDVSFQISRATVSQNETLNHFAIVGAPVYYQLVQDEDPTRNRGQGTHNDSLLPMDGRGTLQVNLRHVQSVSPLYVHVTGCQESKPNSSSFASRFFDFCELDSTLIGSSFFGTVHTLIVPVNNESIRLGRLPGAEKK